MYTTSTVHTRHHRYPFRGSCSSSHFTAFSLIGLSSVTERASADQHLGFHGTVFVAKCSRVRNEPDWGPSDSVACKVFTALHGMPVWTSYEKGVCLSVWQMRALWQNGRKICPDFYIIRKITLVFWEEKWLVGVRPLLPEFLGQTVVGAKSPIFSRYSLVAPQQ